MHEAERATSHELLAIQPPAETDEPEPFATRLQREGLELRRSSLQTLQINVGKLCNQACHHCHVDAGPKRTEIMSRDTIDHILAYLAGTDIPVVDITGGAPEMIPGFRHLVRGIRRLDRHVMVRCNLTIILEPGHEDLPRFYRDNGIELICSLPCYLEDNVDGQRGRGVFARSIQALQTLNRAGYGRPDTGLLLHLVYNPVGANLPPAQPELEQDYKEALSERYGIVFNGLYTITNMPIHRFSEYLVRRGEYEGYMQTLRGSFNPGTVEPLMCRSMVSVDWQGNIYDCDFNQMLDMHLTGEPTKLWETAPEDLIGRRIRVEDHCYGCTAGCGSSCGGALA